MTGTPDSGAPDSSRPGSGAPDSGRPGSGAPDSGRSGSGAPLGGAARSNAGPNRPGLVSLIAGAAIAVLDVVGTFVNLTIAASGDFEAVGAAAAGRGLLVFVFALVAIGFGIPGLAKRTGGRAMAGAGTALGAAALINLIVGVLASVLSARL